MKYLSQINILNLIQNLKLISLFKRNQFYLSIETEIQNRIIDSFFYGSFFRNSYQMKDYMHKNYENLDYPVLFLTLRRNAESELFLFLLKT